MNLSHQGHKIGLWFPNGEIMEMHALQGVHKGIYVGDCKYD